MLFSLWLASFVSHSYVMASSTTSNSERRLVSNFQVSMVCLDFLPADLKGLVIGTTKIPHFRDEFKKGKLKYVEPKKT